MTAELSRSVTGRVLDAAPLTIVYGYRYLLWSFVIATLVMVVLGTCAIWFPQAPEYVFTVSMVPWIGVIAGNGAFIFGHCRVLHRITGRVRLPHQLLLLAALVSWLGLWPYRHFSQSSL